MQYRVVEFPNTFPLTKLGHYGLIYFVLIYCDLSKHGMISKKGILFNRCSYINQ